MDTLWYTGGKNDYDSDYDSVKMNNFCKRSECVGLFYHIQIQEG